MIRGDASAQLLDLAELTEIPVVTTLMARGAFPDSHPQHLGMPGMHGTVAAVGRAAAQRPDHRLGARFDDRVTGKLAVLRAGGQGDPRRHRPAEIGKNRNADVPIVGDVKAVITDLTDALRKTAAARAPRRLVGVPRACRTPTR